MAADQQTMAAIGEVLFSAGDVVGFV